MNMTKKCRDLAQSLGMILWSELNVKTGRIEHQVIDEETDSVFFTSESMECVEKFLFGAKAIIERSKKEEKKWR